MKKTLLLLLALASVLRAEDRLALLIGNGTYRQGALRNPVYDVRALDQVLTQLGFKVIRLENATGAQMQEGLERFANGLNKNSVGLFFYSGHGLQQDGVNYLMPVDGQLSQPDDLKRFLSASQVQTTMARRSKGQKFIFLDACRTDAQSLFPGHRSQGLAPPPVSGNTLISYATAPNSPAYDGLINSPYAESLVRHLPEGRPVAELLAAVNQDVRRDTDDGQIPWLQNNLSAPYSFGTPTAPERHRIVAKQQHNSLEELKRFAAGGDDTSQFMLGFLYESGDRIPRDYRQALLWYEKAAKQGLAEAQFALGRLYYRGNGARQSNSQALYWWQQAAAQKHADAQNNLGYFYEQGLSGRKDLAAAKRYYRQACNDGSPEGCQNGARLER